MIDRFRREEAGQRWTRPPNTAVLRAAAKAVRLRWFTRLWIIQEVVFNAEVILICKDHEISWAHLKYAVCCLKHYLDLHACAIAYYSAYESAHEVLAVARLRDFLRVRRGEGLSCN